MGTMKKFAVLFIFAFLAVSCSQLIGNQKTGKSMDDFSQKDGMETATLGAGCFWCVEAVFQDLKGVKSVVSGYAGGDDSDANYKAVSNGSTNHAEVAQIVFDPSVISFETLLEVFWTTHDPTTMNRQGNDVGTQYRSAIFYHSDKQKETALDSKMNFATKLWDDPIVTEVTELTKFYDGEEYHQNYYNLNPNQGYCRAVINPKISKLREKFSHLLKEEAK